MTREAVIVDVARTAFGKRKGALSNWHPTDLLGLVLRTMVERNDFDPALVDDVVGGCVTQSGEQGCNVTRNAWVAGGLPWSVPATSVDRQCGSSQQAAHFVAQGVIAGAYDIGIACGVESMTRAPMSSNARGGTGPFSPELPRQHQQHARHPVLGRAGARRQVGDHPRGDGRVRAAVARAGRGQHRRRLLPRRDHSRADQGRERPGHRRSARRRRGHPARRHDGEARVAAARVGLRPTSPRPRSRRPTRRR